MQAEDGEAVVGEPLQPPIQVWKFVEVEAQLEQPVAQPVPPRRQALVGDRPVVERAGDHAAAPSIGADAVLPRKMRPDSFGTIHGRRTPPSASATANPACRP